MRIPDIIVETARNLRSNMTPAEVILWNHIKDRKIGIRFMRQKPIYVYTENSGLDRFIIADFYCREKSLVIEVDGNIHDKESVMILDKYKEEILKKQGITIIRFKNIEIQTDIISVIKKLKQQIH